jgi:hypothetical protein
MGCLTHGPQREREAVGHMSDVLDGWRSSGSDLTGPTDRKRDKILIY